MNCFIARHKKRQETGEIVDMQGYGAYYKLIRIKDNTVVGEAFGDYGVLYYKYYSKSEPWLTMYGENAKHRIGDQWFYAENGAIGVGTVELEPPSSIYREELYGDIRWEDGTKASTNDAIIIPAKFDCIICK